MTPRARAEKARRDARREQERDSALAVVTAWQDTRALEAGRHTAADLHAAARRAIVRAHGAGRTLPDGRPYAVPGPRIFYQVADFLLGASIRTNRGRVYTISKDPSMTDSTMTGAVQRLREARLAVEAALAANGGSLTVIVDDEPVRLRDAALTADGVVGWPAL